VCLPVCLAATLIAAQRHSATARADGSYILQGLRPGSSTIRPSHPRYHFTPDFRSVAITNHDVGNVNFVAHLSPRKRPSQY